MSYPDREASEADAAEQAKAAFPDDEDTADAGRSLDDEAPEWDAQEQRQVVPLDDDYR